jgi:hypothetical protein
VPLWLAWLRMTKAKTLFLEGFWFILKKTNHSKQQCLCNHLILNTIIFFFSFIVGLGGGTLWHLHRFLQGIKCAIHEFTSSTILLHLPPPTPSQFLECFQQVSFLHYLQIILNVLFSCSKEKNRCSFIFWVQIVCQIHFLKYNLPLHIFNSFFSWVEVYILV